MQPFDMTDKPRGKPAMRHIDQANDYDCGIACLEMVSGLDRRELEERLGYRCSETRLPLLPFGVITEEMVLILHALGRHPLYVRSRAEIEDEARHFAADSIHAAILRTTERRRMLLDHDGIADLAEGHQAILGLSSKAQDHHHSVAWDGWRVFDPHPRRLVELEGFGTWQIMWAVIAMV